ncbi:MAG TPA: branched-chain amino acid ABC transporter permease [Methanothrix sp.]|nr:branched-chain amino acid ABC transporter permease [Methanothrix sp.]HPT38264.1 branched-chain amino acid ABC transporter permease [Methanothrix sp.]
MFGQLIANGIIYGCIIALSAIGLSLAYRIMNFANFAHGDFLTLGAYLTLFFAATLNLGFPVACILAVLSTAAIAVVLDIGIWKPMRSTGATRTAIMILSIGVSIAVRNAIIIFFRPDALRFPLPVSEGLNLGGIVLTFFQLSVVLIAFSAMLIVHALLSRTILGKSMRALADNPDLARVSGINVDRVIRYTWAVSMGLAALAGIMFGLITHLNPNMGWSIILPMFAAAVLGGIGNAYGAMAGGMIIGLAQEISTAFLPAEYKIAVSFAIMIAVLFFKPRGLLGGG